MKRYALLIESSKTKHGALPGISRDPIIVREYLLSNLGGAWKDEEIETLHTPTLSDVRDALDRCRKAHYVFVLFAGHGHHVRGRGLDETRLILNDKDETPAYNLNCGADRTTIAVDCCRGITVPPEPEIKMFSERVAKAARIDRSRYRATFDDAVDKAEKGPIYLYGCSVDESASDTSAGGLFTSNLVLAGQRFTRTPSRAILDLQQAFQAASSATTRKVPQQHPVYEGGRRIKHFPFSVDPS